MKFPIKVAMATKKPVRSSGCPGPEGLLTVAQARLAEGP